MIKFSAMTHPNQRTVIKLWVKVKFVSLTGPCKGSLLLTHVTFYLHFYTTSQCENQILVDHQSPPLNVFYNVNF